MERRTRGWVGDGRGWQRDKSRRGAHKRDRVAEENAAVAAVSFKSDLSPAPAEQWPRDQSFQRSAKGVVVASERARRRPRLINDKATFYPVRFRNIDKLCKRLIRINRPSVLRAPLPRCGVAVACVDASFSNLFSPRVVLPNYYYPRTYTRIICCIIETSRRARYYNMTRTGQKKNRLASRRPRCTLLGIYFFLFGSYDLGVLTLRKTMYVFFPLCYYYYFVPRRT